MPDTLPMQSRARWTIPTVSCSLALLFVLQALVVTAAYRHGIQVSYSVAILLIAIAQSAALWALFDAQRIRECDRIEAFWLAGALVAMVIISLVTPDTNPDAYAYVGYGKLPAFSSAYSPPDRAFSGRGFEAITLHWGSKLPPLVYGPLWLALQRAIVAPAGSYAAAFLATRLFGLLMIAIIVASLHAMRISRPVLGLVALNPALYFYYVIEAHNDVIGIALVIAGIALAERRPVLGAAVASAAALVKITLIAVAILALRSLRERRVALLQIITMLAVAIIGSLAGGLPYLHAMSGRADLQLGTRADSVHASGHWLHALAAILAVGALLLAVLRRIYIPPLSYTFACVSATLYSWYVGWCIPYAVRAGFMAGFFISLPAVMHAVDVDYPLYPARPFAAADLYLVAVLATGAFALLRRYRLYGPKMAADFGASEAGTPPVNFAVPPAKTV